MLASTSRNGFVIGRGASLTLIVMAVLVCAVPTLYRSPALAQSGEASTDATENEKRSTIHQASDLGPNPLRVETMRELASAISVHKLVGEERVPAKPITEPLLSYVGANDDDSWDGILWLWGRAGRPAAIAEVWRHRPAGKMWFISFASLSTGSMTAQGSGRLNWLHWMPRTPGLDFKPLADAARPAANWSARLKQMRKLSARFSAHEVLNGDRLRLRRLPAPIHRYGHPKLGPLDGAVFVWSRGRDPELVLLIELNGDDLASAKWQYGFAATSSAEIQVDLDGRQVWRRAAVPDIVGKSTDPYWICGEQVMAEDTASRPVPVKAEAQTERVMRERPRGKCSISGKVISAATGEPVEHARMYLHYNKTHGSIFIRTTSDGAFAFKDIPTGPMSLQLSLSAGYQDIAYNPEGKPIPFPPFSLKDGEHRSGIVLKAEPAHQISGTILDENGKIPENVDTLRVLAWGENKDGSKGYTSKQTGVNRADGSYLIDGLGDKPVYIMAINWRAAKKGNAYPPIYYPSTFSRNDAKLITFDEEPSIDNIDITLQKEGGLVIEGTVTDEAGKPVPQAFVVVHRRDMHFDLVTAYTDEQGRYQIQGLGDGEFLVHVDAVHRGLVRTRTPVDLDNAKKKTQRDFALTQGVAISGKFVDEQGNDWQIGQSYGHAVIEGQPGSFPGFSLTSFWNKHRHNTVARATGGSFSPGEGDYTGSHMFFPTKSTFVIQGMMSGKTMIRFSPKKENQEVVKILHDGQNIMESGIVSQPGQEIKDVTIVIATR